MFFIISVMPEEKRLDFEEAIICDHCGKYGRYHVDVTSNCLRLFFLPVFRWNKRYIVKTTCCDAVYALEPEDGKRLERGEISTLKDIPMEPLFSHGYERRCNRCGHIVDDEYSFCPYCGEHL